MGFFLTARALVSVTETTTGAIVAVIGATITASVGTFGVLRSAKRQREPTMVEASQSVLMDVNRVLVDELARLRVAHTELEAEAFTLRADNAALRKENDKLRLIHRLEREIVEDREALLDDGEGTDTA